MSTPLYDYDASKFSTNFETTQNYQKTMTDLLQLRKTKNRDEQAGSADLRPRAQYVTLCDDRKLLSLQKLLNCTLSTTNSSLPAYVKAVIELQFLYGLRISEVLQIKYTDVNWNACIKVKGMKGSENRFVYPVIYRDFWLHCNLSKITFPSSFNRFYFYRLYKKIGIFETLGKNKTTSVTHYLRYMFVYQLMQENEDTSVIQHLLGHKSIKSTFHYINNLHEN